MPETKSEKDKSALRNNKKTEPLIDQFIRLKA